MNKVSCFVASLVFGSILASIYLILMPLHEKQLCLLPIFFGVFVTFTKDYITNNSRGKIVYCIVLIQLIIRYILIPILSTPYPNVSLYVTKEYEFPILIMFIEIIALLFAFRLRLPIKKTSTVRLIPPRSGLFVLLLIISFGFLYVSGYFSKISFVWKLAEVKHTLGGNNQEISSLSFLLFPTIRALSILYIISYIKLEIKSTLYQTLCILFLIIVNTVFIIGFSRLSILFILIPLIGTVLSVFPHFQKRLLKFVPFLIIPVLIITTLQKFSVKDDDVISYSNVNIISPNSLNSYFAGIDNILTGVNTYDIHGANQDGLNLFYNDFMQNIPVLTKIVDQSNLTNVYYNEVIYNHRDYQDQIVPLSISGLMHFGLFGVFLYPFVFTLLAVYFEKIYYSCRYIGYKFVSLAFLLPCSLIFMLNFSAIINGLVLNLFFIFVPVVLSNILIKK